MQLNAFARLLDKYPEWRTNKDVKLILIGSSRNKGDENRIDDLRKQCRQLDIEASGSVTAASCLRILILASCAGICSIRSECVVRHSRTKSRYSQSRIAHHVERAFWDWCGRIHGNVGHSM